MGSVMPDPANERPRAGALAQCRDPRTLDGISVGPRRAVRRTFEIIDPKGVVYMGGIDSIRRPKSIDVPKDKALGEGNPPHQGWSLARREGLVLSVPPLKHLPLVL